MFDFLKNNKNKKVEELLKKGAFLVDVRTPEEFSEGSAEGAINIPLQVLHDHLNDFKDKDGIVVFCRSGNRSGQAKQILEENGFENVENGGPVGNVIEILEKIN